MKGRFYCMIVWMWSEWAAQSSKGQKQHLAAQPFGSDHIGELLGAALVGLARSC